MFSKINLLLLLFFIFLPLFGNAQVLFQADLPEALENNVTYQQLTAERDMIHILVKEELEHILQSDLSENEKFYLRIWIEKIGSAGPVNFREKYELMDGARRFETLDTTLLFTAESRLIEIEETLRTLYQIYQFEGDLMGLYSVDTLFPRIREELRFYDLPPGAEIAEIGAGNERFAACIAATVPDVTLYINDIDTAALRQIAYHLRYNPVFAVPGASFFAVAGQPTRTGLASLQVDRLIIRDAFHHFDYPEEMLTSIRQSMRPGGLLYLIERFLEDCGGNCCYRQMDEATIKDLLTASGFELRREMTIIDDDGIPWHLLSLAAGEEWR
jgi:SAM-dependent methyltransferase